MNKFAQHFQVLINLCRKSLKAILKSIVRWTELPRYAPISSAALSQKYGTRFIEILQIEVTRSFNHISGNVEKIRAKTS